MCPFTSRVRLGAMLFPLLLSAAQADELFKLSDNQRIECGRQLNRGKLTIATCSSYTYLFNVRTSEYFRCQAALAVTHDVKEVITIQTEGYCAKNPRIFDTDSNYAFDATETEPPSTNSFFGKGGFSVWAADTRQRKVRGCITISTKLGSDVSRCVDMKFQ